MNSLHLDGLVAFADVFEQYGYRYKQHDDGTYEIKKADGYAFKQWGLSTITMPIQGVLTAVQAVVLQVIRGIVSIAVGIFTLHGKKIVSGINDIGCALIQAIVLPLLGLFASPCTLLAYKTCAYILRHLDVSREGSVFHTEVMDKCFDASIQGLAHPWERAQPMIDRVEGFVRAVTVTPIFLTQGACLITSGTLSLSRDLLALGTVKLVSGILFPFLSPVAIVSKDFREVAFQAHCISNENRFSA